LLDDQFPDSQELTEVPDETLTEESQLNSTAATEAAQTEDQPLPQVILPQPQPSPQATPPQPQPSPQAPALSTSRPAKRRKSSTITTIVPSRKFWKAEEVVLQTAVYNLFSLDENDTTTCRHWYGHNAIINH